MGPEAGGRWLWPVAGLAGLMVVAAGLWTWSEELWPARARRGPGEEVRAARNQRRAELSAAEVEVGPEVPGTAISRVLAVGEGHACAIRTNGELACWGEDDAGQATPPAGRYRAVAAGRGYSCAIDLTGAIACWGREGASGTPPSDTTFTEIGAFRGYNCALTGDGAVRCWGPVAEGGALPDSVGLRALAVESHQRGCALGPEGPVCWAGQEVYHPAFNQAVRVVWPKDRDNMNERARGAVRGAEAIGMDGSVLAWFADGRTRHLQADPIDRLPAMQATAHHRLSTEGTVGPEGYRAGPFVEIASSAWDRLCGLRADRSIGCATKDHQGFHVDPVAPPEGPFAFTGDALPPL